MTRYLLVIPRANLEIGLMSLVLFVYAGFGSPTPDGVSWPEIVQAMGLFMLLLVNSLGRDPGQRSTAFSTFFWVALVVGLATSINNDLRQVLRDLIAHFFLCIAVLWPRKLSDKDAQWVLVIMSVAGGIISLRFLFETGFSFIALATSTRFTFDGFLKLNTDPLVTFAAAYGFVALIDKKRALAARVILIGVSFLGLMAIGLSALRGPMAIVALVAVLAFARGKFHKSWFGIVLFVVLLAFLVRYAEFLGIFFNNFQSKMNSAGTSAKWVEFSHVMTTAGRDPLSLIFGSGLGARIDVGERSLPFTHTAISYYFAKTGLIGLTLLCLFVANLFKPITLAKKFFDPEVAALIMISIYGLAINPHYKYMTFGFILALLLQRTKQIGKLPYNLRTMARHRDAVTVR